MARKSRDKGKRGEREAAAHLSKLFGVECRRGQQFNGLGGADVVGLKGIHVEVKRGEAINLFAALAQAEADAPDGALPIVYARRSRELPVIVLRAERLPDLCVCGFLILSQEG